MKAPEARIRDKPAATEALYQQEKGRIRLFADVAEGLRAKPAYLLIFGVCALFLLTSVGTTISGAAVGDRWVLLIGLMGFVAALVAALVTVRMIEKDHYVAPSYGDVHVLHSDEAHHPTPDTRLGSGGIVDAFPRNLDAVFSAAHHVVLVGVHQSHILIRYYDLIKKKLLRGDQFRVLLMELEGAAVQMTTMRFPGPRRSNQEIERIQSSIESFLELKAMAPELIEIKTLDFLFSYGGFCFDPELDSGTCFIQQYTFRVHGGPRKPKHFLTKKANSEWFEFYRQEIEALWDAATPIGQR